MSDKDTNNELVFELTLKERPVVLSGKHYVMRELDGKRKGQYLQNVGSRVILNENGKVTGFKSYQGIEAELLTYCMYDENNEPVPKNVIDSWPSTVLSQLYDAAQIQSALSKEGQDALKAETKNS